MNSVIKKAIAFAGSQKALANKVGVDQSAVSKWLNGGGIRSQYISAIAAATNERLTTAEILESLQKNFLCDEHITSAASNQNRSDGGGVCGE